MENSPINDSQEKYKKHLKTLLSIKGIFLIYDFKTFRKTFPFLISFLLLILYLVLTFSFEINQTLCLEYFLNKYLSVFPNLLGFSLGGFAIIVGFGNTNFLKRVAELTEENEYSMYEKLNAIFAFNLLFQVIVLLITLLFDFSLFISKQINFGVSNQFIQTINCIGVCILLFLGLWSLLIIPYLITNIFIFGEAHHFNLKKMNDK